MPNLTTHRIDQALEPVMGWFDASALYKTADRSADVDATVPFNSGRVVALGSDKKFHAGAKQLQMPVFLWSHERDADVTVGSNNDTVVKGWRGFPEGPLSGLVATGGFEFETTEYHQDTGVTYAPNDPLHAPTEDQITGADKSAAGKLFNAKHWPGGSSAALTLYTDQILGIVSDFGAGRNYNRVNVLRFWSVFLPGATG